MLSFPDWKWRPCWMLHLSQRGRRLIPPLNPDPEWQSFLWLSHKQLVSPKSQLFGCLFLIVSYCMFCVYHSHSRTECLCCVYFFSFQSLALLFPFFLRLASNDIMFSRIPFPISDSCSPAAALPLVLLALLTGVFEVVHSEAAGSGPLHFILL